uniref:Uncharacterized protein n=1 Tax=Ditylenchus dipsaci TaxID=166011 RepID=A0A915EVZ5_9BILA
MIVSSARGPKAQQPKDFEERRVSSSHPWTASKQHGNRFDFLLEDGKATSKVACKEGQCRAILNKNHGAISRSVLLQSFKTMTLALYLFFFNYHVGLHEKVGPVSVQHIDDALLKFVIVTGQSMNLPSDASHIDFMECFRKLALMPMAPPMTPMIKIDAFSRLPPSLIQGMQQGMPGMQAMQQGMQDAGIVNGSIANATTSRCICNVFTASSDKCSFSAASFNDRFDDEFTNAATSDSIYLICSNGFKKKSVEKYFEI